MVVSCVATGAKSHAAADCVALLIRQIGTSNGQLRVASPKTRALSNITGKFNPCLMRGDTSRVGCALGLTRIAHSQIGVLESAIFVVHSGTSRVWTLPPLDAAHHCCVAT